MSPWALIINNITPTGGNSTNMGVLRTIGLVFLGLFILFTIFIIAAILMSRLGTPGTTQPPNPVEVNYAAAGIQYKGPPTTALAGYYCIYQAQVASDGWVTNCTAPPNQWWAATCNYEPSQNAYEPPGYSIQLNAALSNGLWIQNTWGGAWSSTGSILLEEEVWKNSQILSNIIGPPGGPCGWLVIVISNGYAYFGFSNDGVHVDWYASYPVGNATIISYYTSGIVLAGPGNGAGVDFSNVYTVLALYYWNGTGWAPAPAVAGATGTQEFVTHAWVYVSNNEAVISWPNQATTTVSVPQPGFSP